MRPSRHFVSAHVWLRLAVALYVHRLVDHGVHVRMLRGMVQRGILFSSSLRRSRCHTHIRCGLFRTRLGRCGRCGRRCGAFCLGCRLGVRGCRLSRSRSQIGLQACVRHTGATHDCLELRGAGEREKLRLGQRLVRPRREALLEPQVVDHRDVPLACLVDLLANEFERNAHVVRRCHMRGKCAAHLGDEFLEVGPRGARVVGDGHRQPVEAGYRLARVREVQQAVARRDHPPLGQDVHEPRQGTDRDVLPHRRTKLTALAVARND